MLLGPEVTPGRFSGSSLQSLFTIRTFATCQTLGCAMVANLTNLSGQDVVAQALAGGSPQRMGTFRFYFEDERWEWCEQVQVTRLRTGHGDADD